MTRFIGSDSPAITVILGLFLLAAMTYPGSAERTASICSNGADTEAMIPQSGTSTLPISVPLAATARNASSKLRIPATIRAAYSPREWPATMSGSKPWAFNNRYNAKSAVSMAGCVYSVCLSFNSASFCCCSDKFSLKTNEESDSPSRTSVIVRSASFQVSPMHLYLLDKSRVMPTYWLPWPGYKCATLACSGNGAVSVIITICLDKKSHFERSSQDASNKSNLFDN